MAQTQEENTSCMKPMEEEEEEEEEEHQRGDWPLLSVCAQEQDASSAKPSFSVKSSSLRSRAEQEQEACGSGIRSLSFSKLFSFRIAKGASLDIDELAAAGDHADACAKKEEEKQQQSKQQPVCRSQSLPMTSIRRFPQGYKKRVADSSSLSRFRVSSVRPQKESPESEEETEEEEEEVGEEEAVCRICMVALWEGSVLKLECQCRGELALAHRDCALKWFRIKGNANCDVCSHDVLNLPVTLRRIHSSASATNAAATASVAAAAAAADSNTGRGGGGFRVWQHGTPILVIVSMLAYFCFLEQLLVGDHGTAALAISLPFAGVLGLFSSLTTIKMVSRRYVWIYSAVQFLFIVLFTHLFYRCVRMQAVIAIILSTFAGFSVAICTNAMLLQIIRWRARPRRPPPSDLEIAQP